MRDAARTSAASICNAAGATDNSQNAAIDFVEIFSGLPCGTQELRDDRTDPRLETRLVGDLVLVFEDLQDHGINAFIEGMERLADECAVPAAGRVVVDDCADLFQALRKKRRRR